MSKHPTADSMSAECYDADTEKREYRACAAGIRDERARMAKHLRELAAVMRTNGLRIIDGVTSQAEIMISAQLLGAADALNKEADALESK